MTRLDSNLAAAASNALGQEVNSVLRTRLRALPASIQTSGLAASCAFLLSKKDKEEYVRVATIVLKDACEQAGIQYKAGADGNGLLGSLIGAERQQQRVAEARAKMFCQWLSKIADARCTVEEKGQQG
ncbi:MAG: type III-B CRISPR module-associated protein Cmr5 [Mycobacteriaceae bacterium]